jgi:hypothetical protein
VEVAVQAIEEGGKRIRLSRSEALLRVESGEVARFQSENADGRRGFSTMADAFKRRRPDDDR